MKTPICILYLLCLSPSLFAQIERKPVVVPADTVATQRTKPATGQNRKERLMALDLTKEQKVKLKQIRQENETARETIENNSSLSDVEKKRKLQALKREQAKQVQAILSEEQVEKFRSAKQNNP